MVPNIVLIRRTRKRGVRHYLTNSLEDAINFARLWDGTVGINPKYSSKRVPIIHYYVVKIRIAPRSRKPK